MHIAAFSVPFGQVGSADHSRLVLRSKQPPSIEVCFDGVSRHDVPGNLAALDLEQLRAPGPDGQRLLLLRAGTDSYTVVAQGVRVHEPLPQVFTASLRQFELTPRELRTGLWLVRLLRLPGATRLLRWWHTRRTR